MGLNREAGALSWVTDKLEGMESRPVISLFSGAGGLDLGVSRAAEPALVNDDSPDLYDIRLATDYAPEALETLARNSPQTKTLTGDLREIQAVDILRAASLSKGEAGLVIGGPPCTPFSKSGFWLAEKRESRDSNASLLDDYVRVVNEVKPEGFILENVQALTYSTHKKQFTRLIEGLTEAGYSVGWKVLLAAEFGVPQLRRRVFVIGRRDKGPISFPRPTHSGWSERDHVVNPDLPGFVSAREALLGIELPEDLSSLAVTGTYAKLLAEVPPGQNYLWHTPRGGGRNEWEWRSRYWTFLLRIDPDRPSTTIQAQPGPWVGPFHWDNVQTSDGLLARRLTAKEIARLFTYPETWSLPESPKDVQKQLGNSVPVELGKVVAKHLAMLLGHLEPTDEMKANRPEVALF